VIAVPGAVNDIRYTQLAPTLPLTSGGSEHGADPGDGSPSTRLGVTGRGQPRGRQPAKEGVMCEYVSDEAKHGRGGTYLDAGEVLDMDGLDSIQIEPNEGYYFECWHPETDGWEVMLPAPPGLAITMPPGSKLRCMGGKAPAHTKNRIPVEGNMREQLV
jgi:hypothetical protein